MIRAKSSLLAAVAGCALALLSGCSESEADRRARIEAFNDELVAKGGQMSQDEMTAKIAELSPEDRDLLSEIATSRMSEAQDDLAAISGLRSEMQAKAAIDPVRADRLVAECEAETGYSSRGKKADEVARCVAAKW